MNLITQKIMNYLPILTILFTINTFSNTKLEKEMLLIDVVTTKNTKIKMNEVDSPVIILNFWASWCTPCIAEFKSLNTLINKIGKKNIFVLGINNDDEDAAKKILKIEKKYKLKFESVMDETVSFADKFMVSKVPTSIIYINKKFYKMIPEKFDFSDEEFIKELKSKAKIQD